MKGFLAAFEAAIVGALTIVAVYRLATPIPAGERVRARAMIKEIPAVLIPRGMRAVAVPVNKVVGVRRLVLPGTQVDVLISGTLSSKTAHRGGPGIHIRTLLQNIEVLSAGQYFKQDAEGKTVTVLVVNLLVTPEQAKQLSLASHQTTIQLVLHNPLDRGVPKTPAVAPPFAANVPPPARRFL